MYRYTLTLPTTRNDGATIPRSLREFFENQLLGAFGGFTATEALGAWVDGTRTYVEPVTVYTLDSDEDAYTALYWIAESAAETLEQSAIYITRTDPSGAQSRDFVSAPVIA